MKPSLLDRRFGHVVAVAQTGSFTKAAQRLSITQSAITKSIADLERELGFALFYRTARGALCTEKGRDFTERASRLIEEARALLQVGPDWDDPFARTIRIGVCPSSTEWRLAEPLAALIARRPNLRFEVMGSGVERLVQLLRSGGIDVAVGFEDAFTDWSDIRREPFGEVHGILFVRKGHPLLQLKAASPADLVHYDCILPFDSGQFSNVLRQLYGADGLAWYRHLHVIDNLNIMMRVVANSDAFALTSEEMTLSPGFSEGFERVPTPSPFQPFSLCCALRMRWDASPAVTAFLRIMKEVSATREASPGFARSTEPAASWGRKPLA